MTRALRPWLLATRLGWRLAGVLAGGVALAGAAVAWRTVATIEALDDAALQSQARLVGDHIEIMADGRVRLSLSAELTRAFADADSGSVYLIADAANRPLLSSGPKTETLLPFLPHPPQIGFFRVPPTGDASGGWLGVLIPRGPWRVVVAQANEQQEALLASLMPDFMISVAWLLVPVAAATVAVGVLTLHHGLRPLRVTSAAARDLGPSRPGLRLSVQGLPGELTPLVGAVNAALDRLEGALETQRRFAGDAAHALRTPLAVLTARLDLATSGAADLAGLREDADRLSRLVGQMLLIARLDGLPLDLSEPVDLRAVAAGVVGALAPLAIRRKVELALTGAGAMCLRRGNAAAIELALQNLVDNALAHAPRGSAVEVELVPPARLLVLDRGPGVPDAERMAVFERFHTGRSGGAGLGLAIVARVAAAHGGSARVEPRPGGGACFVLDLGASA